MGCVGRYLQKLPTSDSPFSSTAANNHPWTRQISTSSQLRSNISNSPFACPTGLRFELRWEMGVSCSGALAIEIPVGACPTRLGLYVISENKLLAQAIEVPDHKVQVGGDCCLRIMEHGPGPGSTENPRHATTILITSPQAQIEAMNR